MEKVQTMPCSPEEKEELSKIPFIVYCRAPGGRRNTIVIVPAKNKDEAENKFHKTMPTFMIMKVDSPNIILV